MPKDFSKRVQALQMLAHQMEMEFRKRFPRGSRFQTKSGGGATIRGQKGGKIPGSAASQTLAQVRASLQKLGDLPNPDDIAKIAAADSVTNIAGNPVTLSDGTQYYPTSQRFVTPQGSRLELEPSPRGLGVGMVNTDKAALELGAKAAKADAKRLFALHEAAAVSRGEPALRGAGILLGPGEKAVQRGLARGQLVTTGLRPAVEGAGKVTEALVSNQPAVAASTATPGGMSRLVDVLFERLQTASPTTAKVASKAGRALGKLGTIAGALGNVQLPFEVAGQVGQLVQALTGRTGRPPTAEEIQLVTGAIPSKISLQGGGRVPDFSPIVDAASARHGVPAEIINAIIQTESSGRPRAVNPELASGGGKNPSTGLMQIRRTTAQALGYDPKNLFDPEVNINAGTEYLAKQFRRYGDWLSAIAAYNAGSARQVKGGKGEFRNQAYVNKVLKAIQR